MGVYDQAARYLAKRDPAGFFRWLVPRLAARFGFLGWMDTSRIAFPGEPDRICDTVAEFTPAAGSGSRRILDIEFQAEPDADMMERLGEYAYRLRRELRYGPGQAGKYQVASVLLNLTGPEQPHVLDMTEEDLDGAGLCLHVVLRTLREEDAAGTLVSIANGQLDRCVLPWIALMRGAAESGIMEEWKRLAGQEPDNRLRADYGGLALVFAELANRAAEWRRALEGWNVRESQQVLEWQREARVEALRNSLLRALELRFQATLPPDLAVTIGKTTDLNVLTRWFDTAITADSLDTFRAATSNGAVAAP